MDECISHCYLKICYQEVSYSLFVRVLLSSKKLGDDMKDDDTQKYKKFSNRVVNLKESESSISADFHVYIYTENYFLEVHEIT